MPTAAELRVGDEWVWRTVDDKTRQETSRSKRSVVQDGNTLKIATNGSAQTLESFYTGVKSSADKPSRHWPLEVGKKWTQDYEWKRADGVSGRSKAEITVVGQEEVEVPAGKFMTFKIERKGTYSNSKGGNGREYITFWYAPDAFVDVKRHYDDGVYTNTSDLISFKRGAP